MTDFAIAFGWGLAMLASFVGWGGAFRRFVLRTPPSGPGESAALGIALAVVVGGVLNLAAAITSPLLIGLVGVGAALAPFGLGASRFRAGAEPSFRPGRGSVALAAGLALVVLVRYAGSVRPETLNRHDDLTGYVVFPTRMLQTGEMGNDPFNVRRMESGLGGMSFLHALALAALHEQNLPLVDLGVGLLAALLIARDLASRAGLAGPTMLAILAVVAFDRSANVNITAVLTGTALTLSLVSAMERDGPAWARALATSLPAAALCAVKSNFIPIAGLFPAIHYGRRLIVERRFAEGAAVLLLTSVCLAPWMEAARRSSGTYLYPILGRGVHGTAHGTFAAPGEALRGWTLFRNVYRGLADPLAISVWTGAVGSMLLACRAGRPFVVPACFQLAVALNALVMHKLFETTDALRYLAPVYTASLVVSLVEIGRAAASGSESVRVRAGVAAAFVAAWTIGSGWDSSRVFLQTCTNNIRVALGDYQFNSEAEVAAARRMQESVPPGEPIVVWVRKPYLLDFNRNPIYVIDWPGAASPPPGMPFRAGPEALARYFIALNRPVFAFEPTIRDGYTTEAQLRNASAWVKAVSAHAVDLFQDLGELLKTRRRIHDADGYVVIDVSKREAGRAFRGPADPPMMADGSR